MKTNIFGKIKELIEDIRWRIHNEVQHLMRAPWYFLKNVWRFRKELWRFRAFDYSFNLAMLTRSLEITADFMESRDAVSEHASRDAKDIRKFIKYLEVYADSMKEAERLTGKDFMELYERFPHDFGGNPEQNPELAELVKLSHQIEARSWKNAWKLIARRGQRWWD